VLLVTSCHLDATGSFADLLFAFLGALHNWQTLDALISVTVINLIYGFGSTKLISSVNT